MPYFSVITASRDRPEELSEAIVSVLRQEFADFEMLIVDDGSHDGTPGRVAGQFADPRLKVIRLASSRGPAGARNAALAEARGEACAILDDDDLMLPGRLDAAARALRADPGIVLVASAFRTIDGRGAELATVHPPAEEARLREILPRHNPICHSTCTVRTEVLRALGGYREALRFSHDYDMILRVAERGGIALLPQVLGAYRFHTENISAARCFLQGAYARVAQECARRRAAGEPEDLQGLVAAIDATERPADLRRAAARVHYQIGEWMFRDGNVKGARPHLWKAVRGEPLRPLCVGLTLAAWAPAWLRRALAPLVRPLVALRYPSWR